MRSSLKMHGAAAAALFVLGAWSHRGEAQLGSASRNEQS